MESKMEKKEVTTKTVEDAVHLLTREHNEDGAIEYLRANREDSAEFCLQTFESYQSGDKTGIMQLGKIIEKLL